MAKKKTSNNNEVMLIAVLGIILLLGLIAGTYLSVVYSEKNSDSYDINEINNNKLAQELNQNLDNILFNTVKSNDLNCPYKYGDDTDGDGILDLCDNCQLNYNPEQFDNDKDGMGNDCDAFPNGQSGDSTENHFRCNNDLNCGSSGLIGDLFCSSGNVFQNFLTNRCNNPGTDQSYCSSITDQRLTQTCTNGCSNGQCNGQPPQQCNDECSQTGLSQCSGNGYKVCGNFDSDSCLEWSTTIMNCASGQICSSGQCVSQCVPSTEVCNNVDDNCNGQIDEGNVCTPQCVPSMEVCNGRDDNCNGQVDEGNVCAPPVPPPKPLCDDGLDNDGDHLIDYPADPGCSSRTDNSELPVNTPPAPAKPQCDDGIDNDHDGKIDYPADSQCSSRTDNSE